MSAKTAYERFSQGVPGFRRPSWDQLALLAAANLSDREGYTGRSGRGRIEFEAKSTRHRWTADENGPHECLSLLRSPEETAEWVERFMMKS